MFQNIRTYFIICHSFLAICKWPFLISKGIPFSLNNIKKAAEILTAYFPERCTSTTEANQTPLIAWIIQISHNIQDSSHDCPQYAERKRDSLLDNSVWVVMSIKRDFQPFLPFLYRLNVHTASHPMQYAHVRTSDALLRTSPIPFKTLHGNEIVSVGSPFPIFCCPWFFHASKE